MQPAGSVGRCLWALAAEAVCNPGRIAGWFVPNCRLIRHELRDGLD